MAGIDLDELLMDSDSDGSDFDFEGFAPEEEDANNEDLEVEAEATVGGLAQYGLDQCYSHSWLRRFSPGPAPRDRPGPVGVTEESSPYELFSKFFTDDVTTLLVTETNR